VDTIMGLIDVESFHDAILEAQDRTGIEAIVIATPGLPVEGDTAARGFDIGEVERILDVQAQKGAAICMPHQGTTDRMLDRCTRELRHMHTVCRLIRERGMVPGLSTHIPETIVCADETGLDVETYISIYNAAGFLMQVEVDWTSRIIQRAKKPVITIKPMAAGQLRPFQALTFVWNTIRPQDMVTVGTMSPEEAAEDIELSRTILEQRQADFPLQETRSKVTLQPDRGGAAAGSSVK